MAKITKKGQKLLAKSKEIRYDATDLIQNMMGWATENLSEDEILEIIKGEEGKSIGLERLQKEVMNLEEQLRDKRKELLKKTMALYFMKQKPSKSNEHLVGFNEMMGEISERYPRK